MIFKKISAVFMAAVVIAGTFAPAVTADAVVADYRERSQMHMSSSTGIVPTGKSKNVAFTIVTAKKGSYYLAGYTPSENSVKKPLNVGKVANGAEEEKAEGTGHKLKKFKYRKKSKDTMYPLYTYRLKLKVKGAGYDPGDKVSYIAVDRNNIPVYGSYDLENSTVTLVYGDTSRSMQQKIDSSKKAFDDIFNRSYGNYKAAIDRAGHESNKVLYKRARKAADEIIERMKAQAEKDTDAIINSEIKDNAISYTNTGDTHKHITDEKDGIFSVTWKNGKTSEWNFRLDEVNDVDPFAYVTIG